MTLQVQLQLNLCGRIALYLCGCAEHDPEETQRSHTNGQGGLLQAQRDHSMRTPSGGQHRRRGHGRRGRGGQGPQVAHDAQPAGRLIVCLCMHDMKQHINGIQQACLCVCAVVMCQNVVGSALFDSNYVDNCV